MLERIGLARFAGENPRQRFSLRMDLLAGSLILIILERVEGIEPST